MSLLLLALLLGAQPRREAPSVLLVTLDTFRGDHLGSAAGATPNLDRLGARGTVFTRARSPVPLTLPSHASILTGLNPPEHGVRDNGSFQLADRHRTLAEELSERGYETAAFVASFVLDRRFGLARGFERYDDRIAARTADLESLEAERPASSVRESFDQWIETRDATRPFFAWVHLYDPHYPYEAPEPFASRFGPDSYLAEIAWTDSVVGAIVGRVPPTTLIAVVGDHGEGLGEHRELTHSLLVYNSTLHVPLILAGPGVPAGSRVEALVRTIDLAATLLDYLGMAKPFGSGASLRPLLEGREEPERVAYSESLYGFHHLGFSPLHALETGRFRFIDAPRRELYEVAVDPGETRNLLEDKRSVSRDLFRQLSELRESFGGATTAPAEIDAETRAKLESLGYLPSTAPRRTKPGGLPDPKDHMDAYQRLQEARDLQSGGECGRAIERLEGIDGVEATVPAVLELAASCHLELGQWERAAESARKALSLGFESSAFHRAIGLAALRTSRIEEAERAFRVAIALDGREVVARHHLGDALRAQKRDQEAASIYREALAINPDYVYSWNGLGMSLARLGRNAEALAAFRKVVELDPDEPGGQFNLAAQLERTGERAEALTHYRRFLEISTEEKFSRERARARKALGVGPSNPPRLNP